MSDLVQVFGRRRREDSFSLSTRACGAFPAMRAVSPPQLRFPQPNQGGDRPQPAPHRLLPGKHRAHPRLAAPMQSAGTADGAGRDGSCSAVALPMVIPMAHHWDALLRLIRGKCALTFAE